MDAIDGVSYNFPTGIDDGFTYMINTDDINDLDIDFGDSPTGFIP